MKTELENLFIYFENRHYTAVRIDTELGGLDHDDAKWNTLLRKSKQAWLDCKEAREKFLAAMEGTEK